MSARNDRTKRVVDGALRSAIHDHGPITLDTIDSAVKRVVGQMMSAAGQLLQVEGDEAWRTKLDLQYKRYEKLRHGHDITLGQLTRCRKERDALKAALHAGWSWGQYEWAQSHLEEMANA